MTPASGAPNEKRPCDLFLESYQALGKVAEFKIALRCESGLKEAFPINEPLLIGLTATTSNERENDRVEIEYDFPLQNAVVAPDTTAVVLTFRAQLSDISGNHGLAAQLPAGLRRRTLGMRKIRLRLGDAGQRGQDLHEEGRIWGNDSHRRSHV